MRRSGFIFVVAFSLGIAAVFGYQFLCKQFIPDEPLSKAKHCTFRYVNPGRCEPNVAPKKREYVRLHNDLLAYFTAQRESGIITDAAVYFRDLENGPSISINSQSNFIPASLLKLPLLITYYKKAESDPKLLQQKVTVPKDVDTLIQDIVPKKRAEPGKTYTVDQLLNLLITQSDNVSWKVLLNHLRQHYSEEDFVSTLSDLGIVDPRKQSDQEYITVQSYAAIFRSLYNSSYLSIPMSDKALQLLTQSEYKNGLIPGIPNSITVAHKFGEQHNGTEQQLHDCGIVYDPDDPYILCVMTRGFAIKDLEPVIQEVSRRVYTEVASRNGE